MNAHKVRCSCVRAYHAGNMHVCRCSYNNAIAHTHTHTMSRAVDLNLLLAMPHLINLQHPDLQCDIQLFVFKQ